MPDENDLIGPRQLSDIPQSQLFFQPPPKEATAQDLARRIFRIFQIALYGTLIGVFTILGIGAYNCSVDATIKLLKDGLIPVLTTIGAVFGTLFGSLFGFVLGHYYRKEKD